jgi:hypothetical protein
MDDLMNINSFRELQTTYNKLKWLVIFQEKVERVFKDHEECKSHLLELAEVIKESILNPPPLFTSGQLSLGQKLQTPYGICSKFSNCEECHENCRYWESSI